MHISYNLFILKSLKQWQTITTESDPPPPPPPQLGSVLGRTVCSWSRFFILMTHEYKWSLLHKRWKQTFHSSIGWHKSFQVTSVRGSHVVCMCGLWPSCAAHIIQMWCSNTECGNTSGREMEPWGMSLWTRSLMEISPQMALSCTLYFLGVCVGSLKESWIKLSLKGRWSPLLTHVGLHSKVLVKIRFKLLYFW